MKENRKKERTDKYFLKKRAETERERERESSSSTAGTSTQLNQWLQTCGGCCCCLLWRARARAWPSGATWTAWTTAGARSRSPTSCARPRSNRLGKEDKATNLASHLSLSLSLSLSVCLSHSPVIILRFHSPFFRFGVSFFFFVTSFCFPCFHPPFFPPSRSPPPSSLSSSSPSATTTATTTFTFFIHSFIHSCFLSSSIPF